MANVSVTSTKSNITVNTTSNVVTVSSTPVNVTVSATSLISNASVRNAISVANLTGYGNLSYDNSLTSNGVISYTGVSNSDINTYIVENIDTDDIDEGSANLYYTTDRANSAISAYTGGLENLTGNITTTSGHISSATGNITTGGNIAAGNVSATRTVEASLLNATGALGLTVTGNATIGGNLDVTGNINSETVVDLLVEDRNITLQYSNVDTAPTSNSQIFIDRGTEANTYLIWSEADDKWGFSNDGTNVTFLAETSDDLTEGTTNLYYSNAKVTDHLLSFDNNILPDTDLAYSLGNGPYRWSNIHVANAVVKSIWGEPFPGDDTIRLRDQAIFYGAALPEGNASTGQSLGSNTAVWGQFYSNTIQTTGIVSDGTRLKHSNATPILQIGSNSLSQNEDTSLSILGNVLYLNDSNINTNSSIVFSNVGVAMGTSATDNTFRISTWTDSTGIIDSVSPNFEIDFDNDQTTLTDQSIELRGNVQMGSGGYTISGGASGIFGSGNIEWGSGNINAAYFHGDGSNITGIAGDIEGVTAGSGLTGGGTTGTVTLDVGAGTGITVNADNVAVDMTAFTTDNLTEGSTNLYLNGSGDSDDLTEGATNLFYTDARFDTRFSQKTTTDLAEGTNLYYTEDRVRNNMANTLVGGANITVTPDLANNIITIDGDLTGDIEGVTAGDGLTGGGTAGDVTLDVGAGYGITANPDNVAFANSVLSTLTTNVTTTANVQGSTFVGNVSGTTADFTGNITAGNIVSNSVIDTTADITTTGNITGGYIIAGNDAGEDGIFIGDINGAIQQEVRNESGVTIDRGKAVYLTGDVTGDTPHVALANAEMPHTCQQLVLLKIK